MTSSETNMTPDMTPGVVDAPVEDAPTPHDLLAQAVSEWKSELTRLSADRSGDKLPRYALATVHPGGLAQLYAMHPTRLANLVRESSAYKRALEGARRIIARHSELSAKYGLASMHLAIGYASWQDGGVKQTSPALMRPVFLSEDGNDVLVQLGAELLIAPQLVEATAQCGGLLSHEALVQAAGADTASFSSTRALNYVRESCAVLPDFSLRDDLAIGIYEHPASHLLRELSAGNLDKSVLVRALAGDEAAREALSKELPVGSPKDRDPWAERGLGDLTPEHHNVVEAVQSGRSLIVNGPQDVSDQVLVALLSESAAQGKSTVHVAGSRSRLLAVDAALDSAGVGQVVACFDGSAEDLPRFQRLLAEACDTTLSASHSDPDLDKIRTELREARQALSAYTFQLHQPFAHFKVSAMDALQVLTDLTLRQPAPRTKIRLRDDVLLEIAKDQGEAARALLHRAADLGLFARSAAHSAWTGVVINAPEQVEVVMASVRRLSTESLPELRNVLARVASEAQLAPATSVRHWRRQLEMLEDIREALDVFKPEIFERSAADMVIATAPSKWRKERGIDMRRSQRSRLVKHAKDMLIPGRHVDDLHRELVLVQEKREVWRQFSNADGWPVLPRGLKDATALTREVLADLDVLLPALATGYPHVQDMPIDELQRLLDRLAADPEGAKLLPQRVALLKEASAAGLDQLLTDLRQRHVEPDLLDGELDLAWWASILGVILASNEAFRGMDPLHLSALLARCCELDETQVGSLLPQALMNIQRRRNHALSAKADQAAVVSDFVERGVPGPLQLYRGVGLVRMLAPVVLTLPTLLPLMVPAEQRVDLVILDGVEDLPVAELVALIARAKQVVVVARTEPVGAVAQLADVLPVFSLTPRPSRMNDQVVQLLAYYGFPHVGIPRPEALKTEPLSAVWVDSSGMPSPGASAIESTAAEVDAVIDVIIDHVMTTPERSLAVVALNEPHAYRIREGVARAIAQEPALRDFFDPSRVEPFIVADPWQVHGVRRDHLVLAVGFAKTPHGRVLHDFGAFSRPEGGAVMAGILRTAREDVTVVSSIRPSEIDRDRLPHAGGQMLVDILATAEGQVPIAPGSWPVIDAEPDRLLLDLAERLFALGFEVIANVGVEGGLRIPLAIGHPSVPERLLVAVLTDDAQYVAEPSLRVRDRLVPQILRDQGWEVFTAMSLAVFIDPASVAQQIAQVAMREVERTQEAASPTAPRVLPRPVVAQLAPDEQAALDATNDARARHDEALTGMIHIISAEDHANSGSADSLLCTDHEASERLVQWNEEVAEVASDSGRGPRPPIARGLPLSAYGDDQLDELALWVRSDGVERSHDELVEQLRQALRLTRRGAQTDAVLSNVIRRTEALAAEATQAEAAELPGDDGEL